MSMNSDLAAQYEALLLERFRGCEAAVLEASRIYDGLTPDEVAELIQYLGGHIDEAATHKVTFVLELLDSHRSNLRGDLVL